MQYRAQHHVTARREQQQEAQRRFAFQFKRRRLRLQQAIHGVLFIRHLTQAHRQRRRIGGAFNQTVFVIKNVMHVHARRFPHQRLQRRRQLGDIHLSRQAPGQRPLPACVTLLQMGKPCPFFGFAYRPLAVRRPRAQRLKRALQPLGLFIAQNAVKITDHCVISFARPCRDSA
ncbi:Uncharacterised protein [Acinetobacter baumannii]|nr:Uncharacterised protein [Acinetobacter baumannii]